MERSEPCARCLEKKADDFSKARKLWAANCLQTPIYRRLNSEFSIPIVYIHYAFRQIQEFIGKIYFSSPLSIFGTTIPHLG